MMSFAPATAARPAETGDDLVENQHDPTLARDGAQLAQKPVRQRDRAP
jgi:hypothetical protein